MDVRSRAVEGPGDHPWRPDTCLIYHLGAGRRAHPAVSFLLFQRATSGRCCRGRTSTTTSTASDTRRS